MFAGLEPYSVSNYSSTPINAIPFATTGGNGTHFSILRLSECVCPIIITCPMNCGNSPSEDNIIIAENLKEFLSIGYYNGWFSLEQLFYNKSGTIEYFKSEDKSSDFINSGAKSLINIINAHYNLSHGPLSENRLNELKTMYESILIFQ